MKILRKYPNRRIYDTETSRFVTLQDVHQLVLDRVPFQVLHSKTGEDLTRSLLLQIITEMEDKGHESLLTNRILEELIRFYGDRMVGFLAPYFEQQILSYLAAQDRLKSQFAKTLSRPYATSESLVEQMIRQYRSILGQAAETDKKPKD